MKRKKEESSVQLFSFLSFQLCFSLLTHLAQRTRICLIITPWFRIVALTWTLSYLSLYYFSSSPLSLSSSLQSLFLTWIMTRRKPCLWNKKPPLMAHTYTLHSRVVNTEKLELDTSDCNHRNESRGKKEREREWKETRTKEVTVNDWIHERERERREWVHHRQGVAVEKSGVDHRYISFPKRTLANTKGKGRWRNVTRRGLEQDTQVLSMLTSNLYVFTDSMEDSKEWSGSCSLHH